MLSPSYGTDQKEEAQLDREFEQEFLVNRRLTAFLGVGLVGRDRRYLGFGFGRLGV